MVLAYRSDENVLQARLGSLLDERGAEVASTAAALRDVYAGRIARAVAGGVAALGGAAVLLGGGALAVMHGTFSFMSSQHSGGILTQLLVGSVAASALAYLPARGIAAKVFNRALRDELSLSGNVRTDLVRVERAQPRRIARRLIESSERASASLPLLGAALLAPLALHALVWCLVAGLSRIQPDRSFTAFDSWIIMSAPIAGLAHLALAHLGHRFGSKAGETPTAELAARPAKEGWYALKITALAGLVPGVLLFAIPPLLIGLTGLLFIPLSFYVISRAIVRERAAIDALGA